MKGIPSDVETFVKADNKLNNKNARRIGMMSIKSSRIELISKENSNLEPDVDKCIFNKFCVW